MNINKILVFKNPTYKNVYNNYKKNESLPLKNFKKNFLKIQTAIVLNNHYLLNSPKNTNTKNLQQTINYNYKISTKFKYFFFNKKVPISLLTSLPVWINLKHLFIVFLFYVRWFGFLYEYNYKSFWSININKTTYFFYCFNFLHTFYQNSLLNKFHLFLYKKNRNADRSFFFKAHTKKDFSLEKSDNIVDHIKNLNFYLNPKYKLPVHLDATHNFTTKYKFLMSYWIFLKSLLTSKKKPKIKNKNFSFIFLSDIIVKNTYNFNTFFATPQKNTSEECKFTPLLRNFSLIFNFFWRSSKLLKGIRIRKRKNKRYRFSVKKFLSKRKKGASDSFAFFKKKPFWTFSSFSIKVFYVSFDCVVLTISKITRQFFYKRYAREFRFTKNGVRVKYPFKRFKQKAYGLLKNVKLLYRYKFSGKQRRLTNMILTKNKALNSKKYLEFFIKRVTGSLSLKYLNLLTILNFFNNKNKHIVEPTKSLVKRNFYFSKTSMSNYLNLYKYWSNITPFFYLDNDIISSITKIHVDSEEHDFSVYIRQYLGGFIENLVSKKVFIKIRTFMNIPNAVRRRLLTIHKTHIIWQKIVGTGFFFYDMLTVLWYAFFNKDLSFLMSWLSKVMSGLPINKHKRFIKLTKLLLNKYGAFFLSSNKVTGFKFDIRGKFGVTGNSKKRHTSFSLGRTSFSRKNLRIDYQQGLVYTDTGVLGVTMIISY